jgi:Ca2+-binding EF-hand superfamily protein
MQMMGFHLDETSATDIFQTIDTDHSGRVAYDEFVLGFGVLKRQMTDLKLLEKSFQ